MKSDNCWQERFGLDITDFDKPYIQTISGYKTCYYDERNKKEFAEYAGLVHPNRTLFGMFDLIGRVEKSLLCGMEIPKEWEFNGRMQRVPDDFEYCDNKTLDAHIEEILKHVKGIVYHYRIPWEMCYSPDREAIALYGRFAWEIKT